MNTANSNNWKRIIEQADLSNKKENQVDQLSDEMGMDESEFIKAFAEKINLDTGEDKNIMGKIPNSIKEGIVESFIYSDKTPKAFYKDPMSFKFKVSKVVPAESGGDTIIDGNMWITGKNEDGKGIPYIAVNGSFQMVDQDMIIKDINSKNADLYADKKETSQYTLIRIKQVDKPNGYLYVLKAGRVNNANGLYVVAPSKFQPMTASKMEVTGKKTTIEGKDATTKVLKFNIKLDTNEGSTSGVSFAVGKSEVLGNPIDSVYAAFVEQAKKQGVTDLSTLKITKFTIVSSASNQWGGKVAATHDNTGKETNIAYNSQVADNPTWNVQNADKNYNLAKTRGTNLGAILLPGIKAKGITEIAEPTSNPRVTDTGGVNDNKRNTQTYPNVGQYAQLIIEAEASGETIEVTPETPDKTIETIMFTQFALSMSDGSGSGKGLARFSNFGMSKPKYLKKGGGGFKSPGYIKRHGGGNRPTSGLAGWFDGLFYSGV